MAVEHETSRVSVAIIMGSDSDFPVMSAAGVILRQFDISHTFDIVSAHRTPKKLYEFAESAVDNGYQVIIAGAGGAAHLPGMVASLTVLPVIGVPVAATKLAGEDSLLSIVQMPAGVPVATVAIDNATNAGILAAQILGASDAGIRERLASYKRDLRDKVLAKTLDTTQAGM
ncbi:MAG: 5-(carboxyamino)imidazole ribonucleotide mutase [Pseudomonadota bacterium]